MMKKAVWISFDLGLKGDYKGLYTFLDKNNAVECGQGLAFFEYLIINSDNYIFNQLKKEMLEYVTLTPSDRIYIIWKEGNKVKGEFINGFRKQSPWQGYSGLKNMKITDSGE